VNECTLEPVIFFTDEAWFCLNGFVNVHNNQCWSSENHDVLNEASLHNPKLGVGVESVQGK
jgi:hypothetical protein